MKWPYFVETMESGRSWSGGSLLRCYSVYLQFGRTAEEMRGRLRTSAAEDRGLFGSNPDGYAKGRPGYPPELFGVLTDRCGLGPGTATLDIGPGPGQATADLLARGAQPLIAVEPDEALASYLSNRFDGRVDVRTSAFEDVQLAPASVSLAVSASAWHWVDQEEGLRRVVSFLAPGGWWAVWWSLYHDPYQPDALSQALDPILGSLPSRSTPRNHVSIDSFVLDRDARIRDFRATGAFTTADVDHFWWDLNLDRSRARSLFGTFSRVLALADDEREDILDRIAEVVDVQFGGLFVRRCLTVLYTAQRV